MNIHHRLSALKSTTLAMALAVSATIGIATPAAHADGVAVPISGSSFKVVCDPSLDAPTFVGQVGGQFQVRGIGHCFTPNHFANGEMFDSQGHQLDGANFVVFGDGRVSYVLYVAPYSSLYCTWVGIRVKFTDPATGKTTSRAICSPELVTV